MEGADQQFQKAIALREQNRFAEALLTLLPLGETLADSGIYWVVLGDMHRELGQLEDAANAFRRATELVPLSELASLALFHSLWEQGRTDAAFDEIRRFLTLCDSPEYTRLLRDMTNELRASEDED